MDVRIQKRAVKLWLNLRKGELDDPKKLATDVSKIGHWGNGDYEVDLYSDEDLEYVMSLVKQSVKKNRK